MSLRYILCLLFIFRVSYADEDNGDIFFNNFQNEENTNLPSMLFALQKNIYEKFGAMEKRFDILGKMNHDLEEYLNEKLHRLEKNLLDKLENYVNDRSDSLEKHVYRKIDELEKVLPDKTDIGIINYNLAACREIQISLGHNNQGDLLKNKTSETCQGINRKLNNIEKLIMSSENLDKNISKIVDSTMYSNFNTLDKRFVSLQENLNNKLSELKKIVPEVEKNLYWQLDVLNNNISENLKGIIIYKLGNIQENILSIKENLLSEFNVINSTYTTSVGINKKIDVVQKSLPDLQTHIDKKIDDLESIEAHIMAKVNTTSSISINSQFCKTLAVTSHTTDKPLTSIDDGSFNHVTAEFDGDNLINIEMYLAIKGKEGMIQLSPRKYIKDDYKSYIVIDVGDNYDSDGNITNKPHTSIRKGIMKNGSVKILPVTNQYKYTPSILSASKLTAFTIKINNGTLEFKQKDSQSPLLEYKHEVLKKVKFIGFTSYPPSYATFLYDCPP